MGSDWRDIKKRGRSSEPNSRWIFGLGVLAAVAFFAWTRHFSKDEETVSPVPALEAAIVRPMDLERAPTSVAPTPQYTAPPPPARTGRESYVGVYECTVNGQRVVSDRRCAQDAQVRTLVIDQPDPREVARLRQQQPATQGSSGSSYERAGSGTSTRSSGSAALVSNARACAAVDQAIEHLNARMRQRYSSAEGERLRAQWHDLKRQRRDLKCGR